MSLMSIMLSIFHMLIGHLESLSYEAPVHTSGQSFIGLFVIFLLICRTSKTFELTNMSTVMK